MIEARLPGLDQMRAEADARPESVPVVVAGGADPTVLEAMRAAVDRGWVSPTLVGDESVARRLADEMGIGLEGFRLIDVDGDDDQARAAVAEVRGGRARIMAKGRLATPALMRAVLDPSGGLRTGRLVCQVVLMEIVPAGRRFLMADTGINIRPQFKGKVEIIAHAVEVARLLGVPRPAVALMAASESINPAMPETVEAAELQARGEAGGFGEAIVRGPLSFDLAYSPEAGGRKGVEGDVVGRADAMVFPDLLSANLTVKAIMYTADCRFGGVLRGTSAPVAFMSRADSAKVRLNSLALALAILRGSD